MCVAFIFQLKLFLVELGCFFVLLFDFLFFKLQAKTTPGLSWVALGQWTLQLTPPLAVIVCPPFCSLRPDGRWLYRVETDITHTHTHTVVSTEQRLKTIKTMVQNTVDVLLPCVCCTRHTHIAAQIGLVKPPNCTALTERMLNAVTAFDTVIVTWSPTVIVIIVMIASLLSRNKTMADCPSAH